MISLSKGSEVAGGRHGLQSFGALHQSKPEGAI